MIKIKNREEFVMLVNDLRDRGVGNKFLEIKIGTSRRSIGRWYSGERKIPPFFYDRLTSLLYECGSVSLFFKLIIHKVKRFLKGC